MMKSPKMQPPILTLRAPNPGPFTGQGTNTYILGTDCPVVVDPGPHLPDHLAAILLALGARRLAAIVVTHAHLDHSALAPRLAALTGAPVLAYGDATSGMSAAMRQLATEGLAGGEGCDTAFVPDACVVDGQILTFGRGEVGGLGWGNSDSGRSDGSRPNADGMGTMSEAGEPRAAASPSGEPVGTTPVGPPVGAEFQVEVIHTPGHMGGHICLALGDILLSGDHVMGWSTSIVSPPEGDMTDYMAGLHRLAARRWGRFLPGHGDPVEDPAARLAELIAHRLGRQAAVLATLAAGPATALHLAAQIYTGLAPALLPAAARNVLAHLIDLQGRGLVAQAQGDAPGPLTLTRFARL